MSDTETVGFTATPDPEGAPPATFETFETGEFLYSTGKPTLIREVYVRDAPESLGDKLVRWSERLERRLPAWAKNYWVLLAFAYGTILTAIAIGCWIRGESIVSVLEHFWR